MPNEKHEKKKRKPHPNFSSEEFCEHATRLGWDSAGPCPSTPPDQKKSKATRDGVLIEHWAGTGAVKTVLTHPKWSNETHYNKDLYRYDLSCEEVLKVLENPRAHTHPGNYVPWKKVSCSGGEITNEDVDSCMTQLLEARDAKPGKLIQLMEGEVRKLCNATRMILLSQPGLLELEAPLNICGDIHGQYHDLLRIFEYVGYPPECNYLFLGDYVDRGKQSLETICLLMCYKVKFPENFFLLRGNHECASLTRIYGFYDECKRRYNIKLWKTFCDAFNCFPAAAVVGGAIFCVHGGLSPAITSVDQIKRIVRPTDVPDTGLLCDLLWADPERDITGWAENDRGVSFVFGPDVVQSFLRKHDMDLICRAHQVVEDGYEFFAKRQLITLFSAPNFCGEFDNAGAIMTVDEALMCSFTVLKPVTNAKKP
eukprot:g7132.t1